MAVIGEDFSAVLSAAQRGDEVAYARLWRDANPPLLRYLRVVTSGDPALMIPAQQMIEDKLAEAGYRSVDPWNGTLEVRSEDGNRLLLSIPNVDLQAGKSYTVVLTRNAAGKLESFRFDDSQVN